MIGETLNHYRIVEKLGEGGMAQVYRADDTKLDRQVALKILSSELSDDPVRIERFEREAKAVAALNHPNIVTIYSVEEARGLRFLTMELVDGESLQHHIPTGGMDLTRFFELAKPLLDAVGAAHKRGIVHRDIKPTNVMLNSEGIVKLLDLGLARLDPAMNPSAVEHDQNLTADGRVIGTVPYMAPEQLAAQPLDHRIDIFALGVVFHEMLTGVRPFRADSTAELISAILRDPPEALGDARERLPGELEQLVGACLEKDPDERFQSIPDLRRALDSAEVACGLKDATAPISRTVELPAARRPSPKPRHWLVAGGVTLLVAVLAAIVFRATSEPTEAVAPAAGLNLGLFSFEESGESADPDLAGDLARRIQQGLGGLGDLRLVELSAASADDPTAAACDYLLTGSLDWTDPDGAPAASITFEMTRNANGAVIWSEGLGRPVTATEADREAIAATVSARVGELLGLPTPPAPRLVQYTAAVERAPPAARARPATEPSGSIEGSSVTERPAPAPGGVETPPEVELSLHLVSSLPAGVVTVYADDARVYQREFSFSEPKGGVLGRVGLKRKVAGELEDGMLVPSSVVEIRTYVAVPGEPARQFAFEPALRGDGTDRLAIDIRKKKDIVVTLE